MKKIIQKHKIKIASAVLLSFAGLVTIASSTIVGGAGWATICGGPLGIGADAY